MRNQGRWATRIFFARFITVQAGIAWTVPDGGMISIGFDGRFGGDD